ncbi:MAG: hypothetical protein ABS35_13180 [Kaistia sp. SCN 65-12]|nr:MAG: hypothetical protein ABS35_13180 [Kaistia sp. SCN 65-12]
MHVYADELTRNSFRVATVLTPQRAADVFACLTSPVRLKIVDRLMKREWSVNELAVELSMSQSSLSQHLAKLRQSNLVTMRRHKQMVFYSCDNNLLAEILNLIELR